MSPPRSTVRPGDLYTHATPFGWKESTDSGSTLDYASEYDSELLRTSSQPGSSTSSTQTLTLHPFRFIAENPETDTHSQAQPQIQASQEHSTSKSFFVFSLPQPQQHYMPGTCTPQTSRAISPSLSYIPNAFPISLFNDSPPRQQATITPQSTANNRSQNMNQDTSAQFVNSTPQDPYSIQYPLTYSPDRGPLMRGSLPEAQSPSPQLIHAQPRAAIHFNYGYEIPPASRLSYPALIEPQSMAVFAQTLNNSGTDTDTSFESIGSPLHLPLDLQRRQRMPIAYTARLADLKALTLKLRAPTVIASSTAQRDENVASRTPQATDAIQSKVADKDDKPVGGTGNETPTGSVIPSAQQGISVHPQSLISYTFADNKENQHPILQQEPRAIEHSATPADDKAAPIEKHDDQEDTAPRRMLRSGSAHARLSEQGV